MPADPSVATHSWPVPSFLPVAQSAQVSETGWPDPSSSPA